MSGKTSASCTLLESLTSSYAARLMRLEIHSFFVVLSLPKESGASLSVVRNYTMVACRRWSGSDAGLLQFTEAVQLGRLVATPSDYLFKLYAGKKLRRGLIEPISLRCTDQVKPG